MHPIVQTNLSGSELPNREHEGYEPNGKEELIAIGHQMQLSKYTQYDCRSLKSVLDGVNTDMQSSWKSSHCKDMFSAGDV